MLRSTLLATAIVLTATPAFAAEPAPPAPAPAYNPWLAGTFSFFGPLAVAAAGGVIATVGGGLLGSGNIAGSTLAGIGTITVVCMPVGAGLGQLYDGEPARAGWVALGGLALTGASLGLGALVPNSEGVAQLGLAGLSGLCLAGWSAWDAGRIANEKNAAAVR